MFPLSDHKAGSVPIPSLYTWHLTGSQSLHTLIALNRSTRDKKNYALFRDARWAALFAFILKFWV